MDPVTNMPIVILKDLDGNSVLPIWVGVYEANAIALEIEKVTTPRPMTHDLIKNLLMGLGSGFRKVVVSELKDDTFYAVIWMERDGEMIAIDSRPSDALALALRLDCPIFVEDDVLKSSKVSNAVSDKANSEELRRWLENLSDEDLGPVQDVTVAQAILPVRPTFRLHAPPARFPGNRLGRTGPPPQSRRRQPAGRSGWKQAGAEIPERDQAIPTWRSWGFGLPADACGSVTHSDHTLRERKPFQPGRAQAFRTEPALPTQPSDPASGSRQPTDMGVESLQP